jgi:thiol-disulfide isomerase/thioredoxin
VPTLSPSPTADVVAQVNDQTITLRDLQILQTADVAMAALLGQPEPSGDDLLDRMVNTELVRQAAQAQGFVLEEDYIVQELQRFLETRDKTVGGLESALDPHDLSLPDFTVYFGQVLLVDQFSRTQAQARGVLVSEYLRQLQQEAHISFGPAADAARALAQGETQPGIATTTSPRTTPAGNPDYEATDQAPLATPIADVVRGTGTGQYAPLFQLPVLNYPGADSLALDDLEGKPAVLSFWTTWCGYCRRQTPVLVDAHARHGDSVQFVGINVKENKQQVQDYITSNNIRYLIGLDLEGQVASSYGLGGFPTTYFLDSAGRVVARYVGSLASEQVESYLQQVFAVETP